MSQKRRGMGCILPLLITILWVQTTTKTRHSPDILKFIYWFWLLSKSAPFWSPIKPMRHGRLAQALGSHHNRTLSNLSLLSLQCHQRTDFFVFLDPTEREASQQPGGKGNMPWLFVQRICHISEGYNRWTFPGGTFFFIILERYGECRVEVLKLH